ncbi:DNA-processing protein DprA [Nonomuraea sp. B12E4]|uniref:DNA-processing protein DprA n=1 Tax=Nonomuraea sp. B12E4 TaxID=3153564 RepID=UPI00325EEBD6
MGREHGDEGATTAAIGMVNVTHTTRTTPRRYLAPAASSTGREPTDAEPTRMRSLGAELTEESSTDAGSAASLSGTDLPELDPAEAELTGAGLTGVVSAEARPNRRDPAEPASTKTKSPEREPTTEAPAVGDPPWRKPAGGKPTSEEQPAGKLVREEQPAGKLVREEQPAGKLVRDDRAEEERIRGRPAGVGLTGGGWAGREEHEARAALMRAADVGDPIMGRLISEYSAPEAVEAIRARSLPPDFVAKETQQEHPPNLTTRLNAWYARLAAANPRADLEAGERSGARLIIPGSPEWPTQLDQLGPSRPLGLWLHGTADLRFSCLKSVAVVGARAATAYGVHLAAEFGVGLGESGWTVVSGGAFGVDGAAHRGALATDWPTVVVLACGVDVCYPSGHNTLFAAVRDQGVVLSECPPGVHPTRARFLIRNRLIAALSRGTIVVEAALRSGALNTAGHALALNRHLGAVPGPVTSSMSAGCHKLLRDRKAVCVTSPEEMIDLVGVMGDDLASHSRAPAVPRDKLNEPTRRVLDAVPSRGGAGPASIAVAAGVSLDAALSALGGLAAAGYIERTTNGWRLRKQTTTYLKAPDSAALEPPPNREPPEDPVFMEDNPPLPDEEP